MIDMAFCFFPSNIMRFFFWCLWLALRLERRREFTLQLAPGGRNYSPTLTGVEMNESWIDSGVPSIYPILPSIGNKPLHHRMSPAIRYSSRNRNYPSRETLSVGGNQLNWTHSTRRPAPVLSSPHGVRNNSSSSSAGNVPLWTSQSTDRSSFGVGGPTTIEHSANRLSIADCPRRAIKRL